jgi:RimJ/RimL family protein N-acetyltransferase
VGFDLQPHLVGDLVELRPLREADYAELHAAASDPLIWEQHPVPTQVEIGWTFLARSYWGGVYNGELKRLMVDHAFRFVSCVVFLVHPQNLRSQRAVEKLGAVRAGTRPDGGGRESFLYELRRLS